MALMTNDPDLSKAYGLQGPEASQKLYAAWADTYDTDFAAGMHYLAPQAVADCYAKVSGASPVLDLGAGTGLLGQALVQHGITHVDGTDISPEMLEQAKKKGVYNRVFEGDLTGQLDVATGAYDGIVSSGTFTHGHVGPEAMAEVLRCMSHGAWAVLSVNAAHWDALGFADTLNRLTPEIATWRKQAFALYGAGSTGPHAKDKGWLLQICKA